jgi:hypothetical protein
MKGGRVLLPLPAPRCFSKKLMTDTNSLDSDVPLATRYVDGHLRLGLGSSIVVSLVEPDETSDAPRFVCARRVIGVLYTV